MNCNFDVIPHFEQGYLNSILISLVYNSAFKQVIIDNFEYTLNDKKNLFKNLIKYLLENTSNPNTFKKITPQDLLLSLDFNLTTNITWIPDYLNKIYKLLNIKFLTIIFDSKSNKYILDSTDVLDPDVIILYHSDLNKKSNVFISKFKEFYKTNTSKALEYEGISKGLKFNGIDTYEDEISINESVYEINSCFLTNNTATIGFFCNGEKFVYNYLESPNLSTCAIVKYDWNLKKNESKCFSKNTCKINSDSCFSFFKDEKLIIYIKKKKEISEENPEEISEEKSKEISEQKPEEISEQNSKENVNISDEDTDKYIKSLTNDENKNNDKDYIIKLLVSKLKQKDENK
jgi:hypothetical protein